MNIIENKIITKQVLKNLSNLQDYNFDDRYVCNKQGEVFLIRNNTYRQMSPFKTRDGYIEYVLTDKYGVKKHIQAHRVVATLYIPNPKSLPQVNHIDHNRSNNNVSNLEWVSISDNQYKRYEFARNKQ